MFTKLPKVVKRELIKTSSNYLILSDIFLNYKQQYPIGSSSVVTLKEKYPTAQNYKIIEQPQKKFKCKLCSADGHSIGRCENYITNEEKVARVQELSLCNRCAGSGHTESECFGNRIGLKYLCLLCKRR